MFEAYTEQARRVIFFSRYEASEFGSPYIEADFLLLALLREDKSILTRWLGADADYLREEIERQLPRLEKTSTSVDLPLSNEAKRVLAHAAEEVERLGNSQITPEHLFLGLLRDPTSRAGRLLLDHGVAIEAVRLAMTHQDREIKAGPISHSRVLPLRIENEQGEHIAALEWHFRLPAVGECISIPQPNGGIDTYRILELTWRTEAPGGSALQVSEIVLKARKKQS